MHRLEYNCWDLAEEEDTTRRRQKELQSELKHWKRVFISSVDVESHASCTTKSVSTALCHPLLLSTCTTYMCWYIYPGSSCGVPVALSKDSQSSAASPPPSTSILVRCTNPGWMPWSPSPYMTAARQSPLGPNQAQITGCYIVVLNWEFPLAHMHPWSVCY